MDSTIIAYLIGPGGAIGVTLLLIMLGYLVPKPYHTRVLKQAHKLQDANDTLLETVRSAQQLNDRLSTSGELINRLVTALIATTGHPLPPMPPVPDPPQPAGRE